jgi:hypothetical protein
VRWRVEVLPDASRDRTRKEDGNHSNDDRSSYRTSLSWGLGSRGLGSRGLCIGRLGIGLRHGGNCRTVGDSSLPFDDISVRHAARACSGADPAPSASGGSSPSGWPRPMHFPRGAVESLDRWRLTFDSWRQPARRPALSVAGVRLLSNACRAGPTLESTDSEPPIPELRMRPRPVIPLEEACVTCLTFRPAVADPFNMSCPQGGRYPPKG